MFAISIFAKILQIDRQIFQNKFKKLQYFEIVWFCLVLFVIHPFVFGRCCLCLYCLLRSFDRHYFTFSFQHYLCSYCCLVFRLQLPLISRLLYNSTVCPVVSTDQEARMVLLTAFTSSFSFDMSSTEWFSAVVLKLQSFLVHWLYFVCSLPFSFHQFRSCSYLAGLWKVQGAAGSGAELKQGDMAVSSWGIRQERGTPGYGDLRSLSGACDQSLRGVALQLLVAVVSRFFSLQDVLPYTLLQIFHHQPRLALIKLPPFSSML